MTSTADKQHPLGLQTTEQLQINLNKIEKILKEKIETLEKISSSQNYKTEEDKEKEELQPEEQNLWEISGKILSILYRHSQLEELILNENEKLKKKVQNQQFLLEEIEMERDVLLEQVHAYLETNSSLRVRLEEQRCQTGALQRQLNSDLESKIKMLENDKEELTDLNFEKDKEIHKMTLMLEQTAKTLKNKETEVLNKKNEQNNLINSLRFDLKKALEEKSNAEEKYSYLKTKLTRKRNPLLKKSLSVGDLTKTHINFIEKSLILQSGQPEVPKEAKELEENYQKSEQEELRVLHSSYSWPMDRIHQQQHQPIHDQLNVLRRELFQVTKKLEKLKTQLITSGVIPEETKRETRKLKRKANHVEEQEQEEEKAEFKNLKNILEDAKNLNIKLQNLREQKMNEINKKESSVDVDNGFGQTTHESGQQKEILKAR